MLKERLRAIYATAKNGFDAYCLLRGWCAAADATGVPELATMAKSIRSHIKGILGYWKLDGATNASMEGFNGKVRWLIKQAYGFRDFKYFRLKITCLQTATRISRTFPYTRVNLATTS